ncbi:MAG TPA: ABC transporter permease subunit, partial [bacterium]|nr:ABC transporter permease subunit [bacterium]
EASLSFLGLGTQPPTPSWGMMINESKQYIMIAPHTIIFPGLVVMILVFAINIVGDYLRDYFDPKSL